MKLITALFVTLLTLAVPDVAAVVGLVRESSRWLWRALRR